MPKPTGSSITRWKGIRLKFQSPIQLLNSNDFKEIDIDDNRLDAEEARLQIAHVLESFGISHCTFSKSHYSHHGIVKDHHTVVIKEVEQRQILVPFVISVVMAADWYAVHMAESRRRRIAFSILSAGLMLGLPASIFMVNTISPMSTAAGVGAVISGILAVQKTMATWLDVNRRFGNQWRARAALRDLLYALQTKWNDRAYQLSNDGHYLRLNPTFLAELASATQSGRIAIRAEQQQFFDTYSLPTPDVLSGLASAATGTSRLMTQFRPPTSTPSPGTQSGQSIALEGQPGAVATASTASSDLISLPATKRFTIRYDHRLGADALVVAQGLRANCEDDLDRMLACLDNAPALRGITVAIVSDALLCGGAHVACAGLDITFSAGVTISASDLAFARQTVIAELVEAAMGTKASVWYCTTSTGEALSRAIACELMPRALPTALCMSAIWLSSAARSDSAFRENDTDAGADSQPMPVGMELLFLNWLRWVRQVPWTRISAITGDSLEDVVQVIWPDKNPIDVFAQFLHDVAAKRPPGRSYAPADTPDDNPFI